MTNTIAGALAGILMGTMLLTGVVAAAEIEGKIKSVDPTTRSITLENGTQLVIPTEAVVEDHRLLQPGAEIRASFEEKDGQKVVLKLEPAR
jgi:preprotein translocase subunit YajC